MCIDGGIFVQHAIGSACARGGPARGFGCGDARGGLRDRGFRQLHSRLRVAQLLLRDGSRIGKVHAPPLVEPRLVEIRLRANEVGLRGRLFRRAHAFLAGEGHIVLQKPPDLAASPAQHRVGLFDGKTQVRIVEFHQDVTGADVLAVDDQHARDGAAHERCDLRHFHVRVGVLGCDVVRGQKRRPHPPASGRDDHGCRERRQRAGGACALWSRGLVE